jgi:competence protein ComEA
MARLSPALDGLRRITGFVTGVALVGAVSVVRLAAQLPDGPGKDALVKVCSTCHEPNRAASVRLTREGWEATVADMKWRGAKGTDEEFAAIVDYLSANFLGEAAPKLNMNRATSIELESVLSLLRKEAAAVIAYRDKVGGFKSIDDLKKVPGVDFKKIEAGKDRIIF